MGISKIWTQAGYGEYCLYVKACVLNPLLVDAATNTSMLCHKRVFDRLQRALWRGIKRTSNMQVTHSIIGQLTLGRELRVQRALLWRRLTTHLQQGSWPTEVATTIQCKSDRETSYVEVINNSSVAAVHEDLKAWGLCGTERAHIPTPCLMARA